MAKSKPAARKTASAAGSRDVLSTAGFLVTFILMGIPVVGLILCIVWAVGEGNLNRRNMCRAGLILMAAGIVLSILLFVLAQAVVGTIMGMIPGFRG